MSSSTALDAPRANSAATARAELAELDGLARAAATSASRRLRSSRSAASAASRSRLARALGDLLARVGEVGRPSREVLLEQLEHQPAARSAACAARATRWRRTRAAPAPGGAAALHGRERAARSPTSSRAVSTAARRRGRVGQRSACVAQRARAGAPAAVASTMPEQQRDRQGDERGGDERAPDHAATAAAARRASGAGRARSAGRRTADADRRLRVAARRRADPGHGWPLPRSARFGASGKRSGGSASVPAEHVPLLVEQSTRAPVRRRARRAGAEPRRVGRHLARLQVGERRPRRARPSAQRVAAPRLRSLRSSGGAARSAATPSATALVTTGADQPPREAGRAGRRSMAQARAAGSRRRAR